MGFTPLVDLKRQEEENQKRNYRLNALIFNNKDNKDKLKDIQIVRFGNDLVVAIYRPEGEEENENKVQNGNFGEIYTAYPITSSGKISEIKLKLKISKNTERTLGDSGEEIVQEKETYTKHDKENGRKITVPAVTAQSHEARNKAAIAEAKADQTTFSARVTRIPRKEKVDGKTVYETAILMSSIPGVSLDPSNLAALTQEQRLRLAINVIKAYEDLHKKGIFHRDIKLENIMFDSKTLEVTVIDRDNSGSDKFIRAPEDKGQLNYKPTPESEIYSLAKDVLPTILSGTRDPTAVKSSINFKFSKRNPPQDKENPTSKAIKAILTKMLSPDPHARGTLADAREGLEAQLIVVTKNNPIAQDEKAINDYQHSLRELDNVLQSPEYKIRDEYLDQSILIEHAYNSTVTETIFRLEELAAEIIRDSTEKMDDEGNKIPGNIPADKVAEYNHHQRQLAILMKEETYLSLKISEQQMVTVVTLNMETKEPVNAPPKQATTTSIYLLAETLQHIRKSLEQSDANIAKPTRTQSYNGNKLESTEKLSILTKFKKEFDDFFKNKKAKFCDDIRAIFKNISGLLNNVPGGEKNASAFFHHPQAKKASVNSKNEHQTSKQL